jgi:hypothetical protein
MSDDFLDGGAEIPICNTSRLTLRRKQMVLTFTTSHAISFDEILGNWVDRYGIEIALACGPEAFVYLCFSHTVLRVQSDGSGNCIFVVPNNGDMPWHIFDALREQFDCGVERMIDSRGRALSSVGGQSAVDFLGDEHLGPSDKFLRYARGESVQFRVGTTWATTDKLFKKSRIASALWNANPHLKEERNINRLLNIVEDIDFQRRPPFMITLGSKSPGVARLLANAMLAWADSEDA